MGKTSCDAAEYFRAAYESLEGEFRPKKVLTDAKAAKKKLEAVKRAAVTAPADIVPFGFDLLKLEDMGRRQMTLQQCATMLGLSGETFLDAFRRFPAVREAYQYGLARGIYLATGCISDAIDRGEWNAARYLLERKGGWGVPNSASTIVQVTGNTVTVDGSHVAELGRKQLELVDIPDAELVDIPDAE